ncbi:MAG TPA: xanthine dehydrogenase accessory protein XdhC [Steroidobacteraceae bacterium]
MTQPPSPDRASRRARMECRGKLPREWVSAVMLLLERESAVVRIVVAQVRGSAPREPGAFMLVGRDGVEGTIGGGRLEWESTAAARELLDDESAAGRLNTVVLGADLGQCCGGVVAVWLERFTREDVGFLRLVRETGARGEMVLSSTIKGAAVERRLLRATDSGGGSSFPHVERDVDGGARLLERLDDELPAVWLYGAGHVGQALARILAELPLRLTWIDSRAELFPASVPEDVRTRCDADSVATVSDAPAGTYFLVMTHSHPLDFALCQAILERNDFAWLGLIGSESKAARFRSRLKKEGVPPEVLARLVCPIGVAGIESKWPAAIAVGVATQVLQRVSATARNRDGVGHAGPVFGPASEAPGSAVGAAETGAATDCGGGSCSLCGTAVPAPQAAAGVLVAGKGAGQVPGTAMPAGELDSAVAGRRS